MALLPPDFVIPTPPATDRWRLQPLTIHDVVRDYDAVMTSQPELWQRFGNLWGWPAPDLSLEQDLIDLAWHQKEAQRRQSFAYAVMDAAGHQQVGCAYVDPPFTPGCDAAVLYWVRTSVLGSGLEAELGLVLRQWIQDHWPFRCVEYPGRSE
ncbi:MAG: GNAT family N-acetyltransferase [Leptolyngbya sp.]|nr:GNAT family N-acetyltransferase [Leptolyngbya sp.]